MADEGTSSSSGTPWRMLVGVAFVAVTAVVFVLGIWVGRDLASRHPDEAGREVTAEAPARPAPGDVPRPVDPAFFDEFRQGVYNSLEEAESTDGEADAEAEAHATATQPAARSTNSPAPTATRTRGVQVRSTATRTLRPTSPPPRPTATSRPTRAAGRGAWVVQIGSTRSGTEAFDWSLRLRGKGFSPHTVEIPRGATTWYRVRLGPFATREEAVRMYQRVTGSTEFQEAYVTTQ